MRDRVVGEAQLADRVRVAVEREDAARLERLARETMGNILPVPLTPARLLYIRPCGWPRIATPGAATARSIREV